MSNLINLKEEYLDKIKNIIKDEAGIVINSDNNFDFEIAVRGRIINNNKTPDEYLIYLKKDDKEIINLASVFTIQESNFYRNKDHFDRLKSVILPELTFEKKEQKEIIIISAGCATGEEPYTIAMLIDDFCYNFSDWKIKIIALDINESALNYAEKGIYTKYKLRNLDSYYIDKYFKIIKKKGLQLYKLDKNIRKTVSFIQCNLIKEPSMLMQFSNVDIVFCENVIIYFNIDSIQRLINNFFKIIKENGYLLLGYTEILNIIKHNFSLEWWNRSFVYKKEKTRIIADKSRDINVSNSLKIKQKSKNSNITNYKYYIHKAIQYLKKGLLENAADIIEDIEKAEIILKEDFYIIKAEYFLEKGDYMASAHACRNAISINPLNIDAHLILSEIYLNLNMMDNADFEIKTSIHINDRCILSYYYYFKYYSILNNQIKSYEILNYAKELANIQDDIFSLNLFPMSLKKRELIKNTIFC